MTRIPLLPLAAEREGGSIACPSISTGVYGFPIALAAPIAVSTVRDVTSRGVLLRKVIFCCFAASDLTVHQRVLGPG